VGKGSIGVNPFAGVYAKYRTNRKLDFPCMVDVELTNVCNLSCPYCPTGNGAAERIKGYMTGNVWNIVLRELKKRKTPVRFVRWGEPTLHPRVYDWISGAHKAGCLTHINTNGTKLDIGRICQCGLDSLKISMHGKARSIFLPPGEGCPHLAVSMYDESNTKDLTRPPEKYYPCSEVLAKLSINWDGTVSACCGDYDKKMVVGDIKSQSLVEIWRSPRLNYYRQMLKEMRHSELPLCKYCSRKVEEDESDA
jgi:radical SAM protein with 4Fe4S-binding SPASM domain